MVVQPSPDVTDSIPEGGKARRVYLQLKDDIARGVIEDGASLRGENKLADTYGVSRGHHSPCVGGSGR